MEYTTEIIWRAPSAKVQGKWDVEVKVTVEGTSITASSHLTRCSYTDSEEFERSGCYKDMVVEAKAEIATYPEVSNL